MDKAKLKIRPAADTGLIPGLQHLLIEATEAERAEIEKKLRLQLGDPDHRYPL